MRLQGKLERCRWHGREPYGDNRGPPQGFPLESGIGSSAQYEKSISRVDFSDMGRHSIGSPIGQNDGIHYAAPRDIDGPLFQCAGDIGELRRASHEGNVQALALQEASGHGHVDRGVEDCAKNLHQAKGPAIGSHETSLLPKPLRDLFWGIRRLVGEIHEG